jgi:6-phosphogluconolactonase
MKATELMHPVVHRLEFTDGAALASALASRVATTLADAIAARGRATLAVSGGSTPKRFFAELSDRAIDWDKVTITLVDERMVPAGHDRSNHGLVNRHLLRERAAAARFVPLYTAADNADLAAEAAAKRIDGLALPFDVVVLGMGTDGHTASFFPGGSTLETVTDPACAHSVMAIEAPGAGEPRLTLTLPKIVEAGLSVLHIEGTEKKAVLGKALEPGGDRRDAGARGAAPYPTAA